MNETPHCIGMDLKNVDWMIVCPWYDAHTTCSKWVFNRFADATVADAAVADAACMNIEKPLLEKCLRSGRFQNGYVHSTYGSAVLSTFVCASAFLCVWRAISFLKTVLNMGNELCLQLKSRNAIETPDHQPWQLLRHERDAHTVLADIHYAGPQSNRRSGSAYIKRSSR